MVSNGFKDYSLNQNYPNPFNPTTIIEYSINEPGEIKLVVYDLLGREIRTLVNEYKNAGTYKVLFGAGDLSSGIYFYRLSKNNDYQIKSMVLLK